MTTFNFIKVVRMNKKILASLVCGLVGVVACNGGSSGSSNGTPLPTGNYVMYTWPVPASGTCPTTVPAAGTENLGTAIGVVNTAGQFCNPEDASQCFTVATNTSNNCITGSFSNVPGGVNGSTITLSFASNSCTSSANNVYGLIVPSLTSGQLAPGNTLISQCAAVQPSSSSSQAQIETTKMQSKQEWIKSFINSTKTK